MKAVTFVEAELYRSVAADLKGAADAAIPEGDHFVTTWIAVAEADAKAKTGAAGSLGSKVPSVDIVAASVHVDTHRCRDLYAGDIEHTGFHAHAKAASKADMIAVLCEVEQEIGMIAVFEPGFCADDKEIESEGIVFSDADV